jgi:hypothetical protein
MPAQLKLGENTEMKAGGLLSVGYQGSYGNEIQSSHVLEFGLDGNLTGSYYNPNFLNFDIIPYYNQSRANSSNQSLTDSSGVTATANFFSGSHFPGSVNYSYANNSSGTFGQVGVPNFTTVGTGQGFGINWSALLPDWPTLSVGYSQGSGSGNFYGTNQSSQTNNHTLNLQSSYLWKGFKLNGFYTYQTQHSNYPLFLAGQEEANANTSGDNFGFNTSHSLPWNGQFYANYNRSSVATNFQEGDAAQSNTSDYTTDYETAGASFHPARKLVLFGSESYVSNLSGYLTQNLANNGVLPPPINLGSTSNSFTMGGGASYTLTQNLGATAQATHYSQHYFGNTYTGTFISGTLNYNRRLLDTFTFSAGVVDFANGQGNNTVGLVGTVNAFRTIGRWELSGVVNYTQNVQSALISYTTSSYSYSANLHRRLMNRFQWTAVFNGSHSGLSQQPDTANHSENYGTTLSYKWISASALYANNAGNALLNYGGLVSLPPLPGQPDNNLVIFSGSSYGGGVTITPLRRLTMSGNFSRSISDTLANSITSHNNMELYYAQLQYRLRRIQIQAGYTRLTQGISASGALPGTFTSYYAGISRWFDFF